MSWELSDKKRQAQDKVFRCPNWAAVPRKGIRLDVIKHNKVVESFPIDEQPYYVFGRSKQQCDFVLINPSVSRVHFALIHHRNGSTFIIDLESAQGTSV